MAGIITTPNAREQFAAIAQLRWRLFVNAFKRKGGKAEVIARVIVYPIVSIVAVGPILGCGFAGYFAFAKDNSAVLPLLLWGISAFWCFIAFSTSLQPAAMQLSSFDPSQLIRFPVSFPTYLITRIFFGILTFTNVIAFLSLFSASIGIGIARPRLFPWAATVLFVFGFTTLFFLRSLFLWMDRWLAQRKTREIALALFVAFSLCIQLVSMTLRTSFPGAHNHASHSAIVTFLQRYVPYIKSLGNWLPPTLATNAIQHMHSGEALRAITSLLGIVSFGIAFLALYARRLRGEFHGENFNESTARPTKLSTAPTAQSWSLFGLPPAIAASLEKEIRYLTRGGAALMSLISPLIFVAVFTNRMTYMSKSLILPAALAYVLFGLFAALYNILGADGAGVHLYLLAPIRIRDVFIAKNIVSATVITTEIILTTLIVSISHRPTLAVATAALLWAAFAILVNLAVGNVRSIYSPRKVQLNKIASGPRQPTSRSGALISLGVLFGSLILCMGVIWTSNHYGHPWLATPIFLTLTAAAFAGYIMVLNRIDQIALNHRETLAENLCKT